MLLLTFTAGANQYAVDVAQIIELVPRVELHKIPHAPAALAGLLSYRGKVVPVIDLGLLLGVAPCQERLSTRIILVNDSPQDHHRRNRDGGGSSEETDSPEAKQKPDPNLLGLMAECVCDLTYIEPEHVVPTPVSLPRALYLGDIFRTKAGIVQLMDSPGLAPLDLLESRWGIGNKYRTITVRTVKLKSVVSWELSEPASKGCLPQELGLIQSRLVPRSSLARSDSG
jgi:chemotaxis-related protein WspB